MLGDVLPAREELARSLLENGETVLVNPADRPAEGDLLVSVVERLLGLEVAWKRAGAFEEDWVGIGGSRSKGEG